MVLFYCYEIVLNIEQVTLTGSHSGASSHCSTVVAEPSGNEGILGKETVTVSRSYRSNGMERCKHVIRETKVSPLCGLNPGFLSHSSGLMHKRKIEQMI